MAGGLRDFYPSCRHKLRERCVAGKNIGSFNIFICILYNIAEAKPIQKEGRSLRER